MDICFFFYTRKLMGGYEYYSIRTYAYSYSLYFNFNLKKLEKPY